MSEGFFSVNTCVDVWAPIFVQMSFGLCNIWFLEAHCKWSLCYRSQLQSSGFPPPEGVLEVPLKRFPSLFFGEMDTTDIHVQGSLCVAIPT